MPKNKLPVIAGEFKQLQLEAPTNVATHPMGAREKSAMFNMLQPWLDGAKVLDLYAGSGALGIEALSRGAASADFVENDKRAQQAILANLDAVAERYRAQSGAAFPPERAGFFPGSVAETLQCEKNPGAAEALRRGEYVATFDIVIADPPYDDFDLAEIAKVAEKMRKGGILALSFPAKTETPSFASLKLLKARRYAGAGIAIYQK